MKTNDKKPSGFLFFCRWSMFGVFQQVPLDFIILLSVYQAAIKIALEDKT